MRQLIIYSVLICLFYSCKEKTSYQLRILIKNSTDNNLTVTLFPKVKYMNGDLYDFTEVGGGFRNTTFEITAGLDEELYYASDLKIQPNILTAQVFDSIHIKLSDQNKRTLRFSTDTVIGYNKNMYKETAGWVYEIHNFDLATQFQRNPVEFHDYSFVISQDNYLEK